jgi:hypothetical protein
MPNALDTFRAQREVADQLHARLTEVAVLLDNLRTQVEAIAGNPDLRAVLREEQTLLARTQDVLANVRRFREHEVSRFWPAVWRRWLLALVFALASTAAGGAGYGWVTKPWAAELEALRSRAELADNIAQRTLTMTPSERRQLDVLMKFRALSR